MKPNSEINLSNCLKQHARLIYKTLRVYEHNQDICDELYQEVALALWRALPSFRKEASIKTFIARITHNIAVSHVRKVTRRPFSIELDNEIKSETPSPEIQVDKIGKKELLLKAIFELPIKYRQVMVLYLEEFRQSEIADVLGISESNVAVRLSRARAKVTEKMEIYK